MPLRRGSVRSSSPRAAVQGHWVNGVPHFWWVVRSEALHLGSQQCVLLSLLLLRSSRVLLLLLSLLLLLPQHLLPHHLEERTTTAVGRSEGEMGQDGTRGVAQRTSSW